MDEAITNRGIKCQHCGCYTICIERHHIVPRSEGGTDDPENIKLLCPTCHREAHLPSCRLNMYGETREAWEQSQRTGYINVFNDFMFECHAFSALSIYLYLKRWLDNPDGMIRYSVVELEIKLNLSKGSIFNGFETLKEIGAVSDFDQLI